MTPGETPGRTDEWRTISIVRQRFTAPSEETAFTLTGLDTEAAGLRGDRRQGASGGCRPSVGKGGLADAFGAGILRLHFHQQVAAHHDIVVAVFGHGPD